ncbi:MAG: hypothetical protein OXH94_05005 [Rhodospirillales bacterium]|nr:hypothetical protein [Rhodospirillales bacterium]
MFGGIRNALKDSMKNHALSSSRKEVQRFVDGLVSMGDEDLGIIVAVATVVRINMEEEGFLPKKLFSSKRMPSAYELGQHQMALNKLAKDFNRLKQPTDAVAVIALSYSLRCLNVAELRDLGRAIWGELERGFPHVEDKLKDGEKLKGEKFPARVWEEWRQIPAGLEPAETRP